MGRVVFRESAYLEGWVARSDWAVDDAEWSSRLEAKSAVVGGTAKQDHQWKLLRFDSGEKLRHQSSANALALMGGSHRQRRYGRDPFAAEVAPSSHHVPDHRSALHGDEFEFGSCILKSPGVNHDVDFFLSVSALVREGSLYQPEDGGSVRHRGRANVHPHRRRDTSHRRSGRRGSLDPEDEPRIEERHRVRGQETVQA